MDYEIEVERIIVRDGSVGRLLAADALGWRPASLSRQFFLRSTGGERPETVGFMLGRSRIVDGRLPEFAGLTLEAAVRPIREARAGIGHLRPSPH